MHQIGDKVAEDSPGATHFGPSVRPRGLADGVTDARSDGAGGHVVGIHKMDFLRTIYRAPGPKNIMNPGEIFAS